MATFNLLFRSLLKAPQYHLRRDAGKSTYTCLLSPCRCLSSRAPDSFEPLDNENAGNLGPNNKEEEEVTSPESFQIPEDLDLISPSVEEEPWKALLAMSARASWRATVARRDSPIDLSIREILRDTIHATRPRHVFKTVETMAERMRRLAKRRTRERVRILGNSEYTKGAARKDADAGPLLYGPNEAIASLRFKVNINFQVTKRVLNEAYSLLGRKDGGTFRPRKILDFGIGCGSSSAAALDVFGHDFDIEWIHGIDASKVMRETSERFLEEFVQHSNEFKYNSAKKEGKKPWAPRITTSAHLSSNISSESVAEAAGARAAFDLCLFNYTATEMTHNSSILAVAALLWEKLKPGGLLVVIEPGTGDGFSTIRSIRSMLLDCCPPDSGKDGTEECHIIAPCTHNGPCPLGLHIREDESSEKTESESAEAKSPGDQKRPLPEEVVSDEEFERMLKEDEMGDEEYEKYMTKMRAQNSDDEDEEPDDGEYTASDEEDWSESDEQSDDDNNESQEEEEEVKGFATKKGFCSFVQTFPGTKGQKFSYLVAQKRVAGIEIPRPVSSFANVDLSEKIARQLALDSSDPELENRNQEAVQLATRFLASDTDQLGLDFVAANPSSFGRIIRAPAKRSGHVLMATCTTNGILEQTIARRFSRSASGLYSGAKKARWGGFWPNGANLK